MDRQGIKKGLDMGFFTKFILSVFIQLIFWGGLLFLPAGRFDWPRAWIFLAVLTIISAASFIWIFKDNEGLMNERFKPTIQKDQPLADKIVVSILILSFCALLVAIPTDVFYLHLLPIPSNAISYLGLALFVIGWLIISLTLRTNTFAAPVVKYQEERHQHVVKTGVYHFVRHPMYAGSCLLFIGVPLWLQSYTVALLAVIPILILMIRITIEEQFLVKHLSGYAEYRNEVPYRLIPMLW